MIDVTLRISSIFSVPPHLLQYFHWKATDLYEKKPTLEKLSQHNLQVFQLSGISLVASAKGPASGSDGEGGVVMQTKRYVQVGGLAGG